ncbi:HlyIII-domain-containing protein [Zopfochytrium polystomum]|nr:HlyIII-domain-containing protein [Zopfochytrium polystomum]
MQRRRPTTTTPSVDRLKTKRSGSGGVAESPASWPQHLWSLMPQSREEVFQLPRKLMDSTVGFHLMPSWFVCQHHNKYILSGYRRIQYTYRGCVRSLFYIHNETGNIYTHLIGAVFVGLLTYTTYTNLVPIIATTQLADRIVLAVFLASAIICLGLSAVFHTCCCHSMPVAKNWNIADYVGIVILIVGSNIPSIYYGFYCDQKLQAVYTGLILLFGFAAGVFTVAKRFSTPKYRHVRVSVFVALGLTGALPLVHSIMKYGVAFAKYSMASENLVVMALMYLIGAGIFAGRIPERWFPGKFDIWFQSHQIFHVLVVSAAITHYNGVIFVYRWWHEHNHQCEMSMPSMVETFRRFGGNMTGAV